MKKRITHLGRITNLKEAFLPSNIIEREVLRIHGLLRFFVLQF